MRVRQPRGRQGRILLIITAISLVLAGCGSKKAPETAGPTAGYEPRAVTADIQAGIEKHIEEQSLASGGYFKLAFDNRELNLKLVRVHIEYLASLGPRLNFACVDLADTDGEVYDVDFFMEGEPGAMTVTETTVHKINGRPLYAWEEAEDHTWHRVPIEGATNALLDVIEESDQFEFVYKAILPHFTEPARMWLPIPVSDRFQEVTVTSISVPGRQRMLEEPVNNNKVLFVEMDPADSGKTVEMRFQVKRLEKSAYADERPDPSRYLNPERLVPANENFRSIATQVLEGKNGDLVRARALYDHVIERMSYKKYGEGWGKGDAVYACDSRYGNCTDFHSYFIALARAAGIPARFAIGAAIPSSRNEGGISGYHCWAEFYAEGKWWPVDISEADKYTSLATYYFGHHPANRVEFSRGRDLVVEPGPASGPINFFAYPVIEVNGRPAKAKVAFSFTRKS